jgi:Na+-transporting methylmalonyl-CoA/oxaloacetate decarboxylase gamma subunit
MKKRILSIIILAIMLFSAFALISCGKEEENKCIACQSALVEYQCENGHSEELCVNKECAATVNGKEVECKEEGCEKELIKKMKFKLDFGALGESAMILCKGMLGIFIVTGVIIAFILILNTVVEKVKQSKENKENE